LASSIVFLILLLTCMFYDIRGCQVPEPLTIGGIVGTGVFHTHVGVHNNTPTRPSPQGEGVDNTAGMKRGAQGWVHFIYLLFTGLEMNVSTPYRIFLGHLAILGVRTGL